MKLHGYDLHTSRWWIKRLALFVISVTCVYGLLSLILYKRMLADQSHTIARLSTQLPPSVLAGVFINVSKQFNSQMSAIYSQWHLNTAAQQARTRLRLNGFKAFVMCDLEPQKSDRLFGILDDLVNVYIDFIESSTSPNDDPHSFPAQEAFTETALAQNEDDSLSNPFSTVLQQFLNEIWNGDAVSVAGVVQLPTSFLGFLLNDSPLRWGQDTFFPSLLNVQKAMVESMTNCGLSLSIQQPLVLRQDHVNFTRVSVSLQDPDLFLQAFCGPLLGSGDFCDQWSLDRDALRSSAAAALHLVGQDLRVEWSLYWALVDHNIIISNHKNFVQFLLEKNQSILKDKTGILQAEASQLAVKKTFFDNADFSKFSFYLNTKNAQNKLITFLDNWQHTSASFRDLIVSRSGVQLWSALEEKVADVTSVFDSVQMFWGLEKDLVWTEWQLENPSDDLFLTDNTGVSEGVLHFIDHYFLETMTFGTHAEVSLTETPVFRQIGALQLWQNKNTRLAAFGAQGQIPLFASLFHETTSPKKSSDSRY